MSRFFWSYPVSVAPARRRRLSVLLLGILVALLALVATGNVLERREHTLLVKVGQPAPDFTLPISSGGNTSLVAQRGHPVLVAFLPSVQCGGCKAQLRLLEAALPDLMARDVAVFAISTDEPQVQQTVSQSLHLHYALLAEDVIIGRHPAGRAYGVFHQPGAQQGPVDANGLFVLDSAGIVRAVDVAPAGQLTLAALLTLVQTALSQAGAPP